MTSKILFVAPDDMRAALERESKRRSTTMSAIIRLAVADWLSVRAGERVETRVVWGGNRENNDS